MALVVIRCPNTGRDISTGIEIDPASFARLPDILSHSKCPLCGLYHVWWKREARLDDSDLSPPLEGQHLAFH
jgi:hypothetical protein